MDQTVFNRYEKKYLLTMDQYEEILRRLPGSMVPDQYGKYSISNIYFDTPDDLLIRRSLTKPVYKEKLRLRSYGTPDLQTPVFLEIKKKYRRMVNKRRIVLPLEEAEEEPAAAEPSSGQPEEPSSEEPAGPETHPAPVAKDDSAGQDPSPAGSVQVPADPDDDDDDDRDDSGDDDLSDEDDDPDDDDSDNHD